MTKADHLWYFPLLQPFDFAAAERTGAVVGDEDHIVIRQDLSNLADAIRWLRSHDDQARRLADNSKAKAERLLGEEGILDYMQVRCVCVPNLGSVCDAKCAHDTSANACVRLCACAWACAADAVGDRGAVRPDAGPD